MEAFEKEVQRISFSNTTEKKEFLKDVKVLLNNSKTSVLVNPKTIQPLYFLYLSLVAEVNVFSSIWNRNIELKEASSILYKFFFEITEANLFFPKKNNAVFAFVKLCDSNLSKADLKKLLESKFLDEYPLDKIQKLPEMYLVNIIATIHFFYKYESRSSKEKNNLAFDILKSLDPNEIDEKTPDDIFIFLEKIVPYFVERFAHRMHQKTLFKNPKKFEIWFLVWKKHQYQLEENEMEDVAYYKTDFPTIIKYITEYIWWNNGLFYGFGNKHYEFGSHEFFFLAAGGSVRKVSSTRPYTRRMARGFVELPYDLDLGEQPNFYLYLFGKSLGGGEKLSRALMSFMRHPRDGINIQKEFDKWNPIIQKLSSNEFEQIVDEGIQTLMGYIYHCLRDKQNYSIQGKTLVHIMHESDDYYRRILQRIEIRKTRKEKKSVVKWAAQKSIKPFVKFVVDNKKQKVYECNIIELTNEQQLIDEGNRLRHCVGTYVQKCKHPNTSIWSLRYLEGKKWQSKVTLELQGKTIVQARGSCNAHPNMKERNIINKWVAKEKLLG